MIVSLITAVLDNVSDRTIESVKSQTNKNFEWVVVHDNFHTHDSFPTFSATKELWLGDNYGPSVCRNIGFQISNGDVIAYLDSDDIISPNRISNLLECFETYNPEVYLSGYTISQDDKELIYNPYEIFGSAGKLDLNKAIQKVNVIIPLGLAHSRKAWYLAGGFQRGIVCGEDGIFLRRILDRIDPHDVLLSDSNAGTYFINPVGQSRTQKRFSMGAFAYNGDLQDNGRYLDENWFETYSSVELFDAQ
jgi:glycosyltransferase involved in cell wall biosynthesis